MAFAEPARSAAKPTIDAAEMSRIKFLQVSLVGIIVGITKTLASAALFPFGTTPRRHFVDFMVYKLSILTKLLDAWQAKRR
jgi:hypothetical protein